MIYEVSFGQWKIEHRGDGKASLFLTGIRIAHTINIADLDDLIIAADKARDHMQSTKDKKSSK